MAQFLAMTTEQAARLAGLSEYQLRYWADTGFYTPSISNERGRPYGRIYSFRDVVGLRTLAILRQKFQVPLQELRKVGEWLEANYEQPWSSLRFFVAGGRVYFRDPALDVHRDAGNPEQTVIPIHLDEVAAATEAAADRMNERTPDEIGRIIRHRYTSHNYPIIAGTRIRAEAVWHFHQAGYTVDQILFEYPRLTPRDVEAAIEYESQRRAG